MDSTAQGEDPRFKQLSFIGKGSFSQIFRAYDSKLQRNVVIKREER